MTREDHGCPRAAKPQPRKLIETRTAEAAVQAMTGQILGHGWNTD